MSVLDAIIRYKELEQTKTRADIGMISNAFQNFQQSRQNTLLLDMENKKLNAELATKGLRFGDNGQIVPATDLIDSLGTTKEWKPRTKEEAFEFETKKAGLKGKSIADVSDITSEQQLQARALSRKIYGVRGAEFGLPAVYEEMRKGKNIDEIEDSIRYAGQSKEFAGPIRNAAQSILMNTSQDKAQTSMDYIDDLVSKGDTEGVKSQLKRLAITQAPAEMQGNMIGKERTIKLLSEIQGDLNTLEKNGVNTNIFSGTAENIASKLGTVKNPEMRKVATKISAALQNYRRSMTGVQFGMPENKEYKVMFPSIGRTANFNTANINALKEVMSGDLDNFYSLSMGEKEYRNIFKQSTETQTETKMQTFNSEAEAEEANLPKGTIVTINGRKARID